MNVSFDLNGHWLVLCVLLRSLLCLVDWDAETIVLLLSAIYFLPGLFRFGYILTDYKAASLSKATFKQYRENDSTPDMFVKVNEVLKKLLTLW